MKNFSGRDKAREILKNTKALAVKVKNSVRNCNCTEVCKTKLTAEGRVCNTCNKLA